MQGSNLCVMATLMSSLLFYNFCWAENNDTMNIKICGSNKQNGGYKLIYPNASNKLDDCYSTNNKPPNKIYIPFRVRMCDY